MQSIYFHEEIIDVECISIQATDADPLGPNSQIQYSIAFRNGSSSSPMFTIDATSGGVSALGLDYERATSHSLTITASDAGTPAPLTATTSLDVTVTVRGQYLLYNIMYDDKNDIFFAIMCSPLMILHQYSPVLLTLAAFLRALLWAHLLE